MKPNSSSLSTVSNAKVHSKDLSLLGAAFKAKPRAEDFPFQLSVDWHGVPLVFCLQKASFLQSLKSYFPPGWQRRQLGVASFADSSSEPFPIYLIDPDQYNLPASFWEDPNPDCRSFQELYYTWSLQRDFVCLRPDSGKWAQALLINDLDDGFFNLMRLILPKFWLPKSHFLLHSSCVVDQLGQAYLCLGPSGAGKTTISSFLPKAQVLGDDMNLLSLDGQGGFYVTPSLVGQRIQNPDLFGARFPLKQVLWLEKSERNHLHRGPVNHLPLRLYGSLVNLIWNELNEDEILKVQKFIHTMSASYFLENLKFNLEGEIWNYVFSD